jgi:hypothetical protein
VEYKPFQDFAEVVDKRDTSVIVALKLASVFMYGHNKDILQCRWNHAFPETFVE